MRFSSKLAVALVVPCIAPASSQIAGMTLRDEISAQDKALFAAFNRRDIDALREFFAPDLEFYQDNQRVTNLQENMETFRDNFSQSGHLRRELVAGTLEVYPLKDFGAMELGVHRFYWTDQGGPERLSATAKFVHIWRKQDGSWKITRVISYDHKV